MFRKTLQSRFVWGTSSSAAAASDAATASSALQLSSASGSSGVSAFLASSIAKASIAAASSSMALLGVAASCTSPYALVFGCGFFLRLASLPVSIFGDRSVSRIACALPEVQVAFQQYNAIVNHPRAILWEKKVAAQKLQNDRNRIFREHRTNNVLIVLPHMLSVAWCVYCLTLPGQYVLELLTLSSSAPAVGGAGSSAWVLVAGADPTLGAAATLTLVNCWMHLKRREGFNDMLDGYVKRAKRIAIGSCAAVWGTTWLLPAAVHAVSGAAAVLPVLAFPSYVGPLWLGMGLAGLVKVAITSLPPLRFMFGIADYPPEHGTYGGYATASAHEYRLAVSGLDPEERYLHWIKSKKTMEFECDARIYRMLKQIGLYNVVEELEFEMSRNQQKLRVATEKAVAKHSPVSDSNDESNVGCGDDDSTLSESQKRRRREYDATRSSSASALGASGAKNQYGGYIANEALAKHMEEQAKAESDRIKDRVYGRKKQAKSELFGEIQF